MYAININSHTSGVLPPHVATLKWTIPTPLPPSVAINVLQLDELFISSLFTSWWNRE